MLTTYETSSAEIGRVRCSAMRIAFLMSVASPFSRDIALEIAELGHEIHVVDAINLDENTYIRNDDTSQQEGIQVVKTVARSFHTIPYRRSWGSGMPGFAWRLSRVLRNIDVDILLTIHGGAFAGAAYLSRFRPYALYVTGSDVLLARRFKWYLSRLALTSARVVFANGEYLARKARELAPRAKVIPLYIGTDPSKFRPGERRAAPISIVCTRGFLPIYNNEVVIRALALLPNELPEYEVVFAAAGPELEKARKLADKILAPWQRERIKFLGGVSRETLAELLSKAHIYVSMSLSDGTSLSLMEALACGVFPVLSDIPANQEWIEPARNNGILVPTDDPAKLAKALERAILDEHLRTAAQGVNRKLVVEHADQKRNMKTLVDELARHVQLNPSNARAVRSAAQQIR